MDLFIKLQKIGAALMVNLGIGYQADLKPCRMDADAVFNILARAGNDKAASLFPYLARYTHIKAARVKLADAFFIAPDTAGGKRGGHGSS